MAGVIAGNEPDSLLTRAGVAPAANIIALKALGADGKGTISRIIMAIDYAISVKNVYNIASSTCRSARAMAESYNTDPLTIAAKRAFDAGIVVVAAAGNMGKAANGQPRRDQRTRQRALGAHRRRFEHRGHRRSADATNGIMRKRVGRR